MEHNHNKKNILITGGTSGIGLEIVKNIERINKYNLIIIDKNKKALKKIENSFSVSTNYVDLSSKEDIKKFLLYLKRKKIIVNCLINNAGYQESVDILKISLFQWQKIFRVNLEACFLLSQYVAKSMIKNQIEGSIINITSIHSQIIRGMAHYSCSKAGLEMLTKELAYRLAQYNIRVNAVAPGAIDTPLIREKLNTNKLLRQAALAVPLKKIGEPKDVANVVEFLIADKSKYITGTTIVVDGGLSLVI
jgi:glucose 1-dehydrogenase